MQFTWDHLVLCLQDHPGQPATFQDHFSAVAAGAHVVAGHVSLS